MKWSAGSPNWAISRGNRSARLDHFGAWAKEVYGGIEATMQLAAVHRQGGPLLSAAERGPIAEHGHYARPEPDVLRRGERDDGAAGTQAAAPGDAAVRLPLTPRRHFLRCVAFDERRLRRLRPPDPAVLRRRRIRARSAAGGSLAATTGGRAVARRNCLRSRRAGAAPGSSTARGTARPEGATGAPDGDGNGATPRHPAATPPAAGFRDVEVLPIEHDQFRFYRLHV